MKTLTIPEMINSAINRISQTMSYRPDEIVYLCGLHESVKWTRLIKANADVARKISADCRHLNPENCLGIWNMLSAKAAGDLFEVYTLKLRFLHYLKMQAK